jgi:hemerythrin superfamily protein
MRMDSITLLKADHKTVEQLFKRFEKAGGRAYGEKREIVDRMIEELSKHAAIEERLFYPVVRATVPSTESITLESLEEHHIVKWVLSELDGMSPENERFDAKVTVLIENVRHHVKEEEGELFPMVRDALGRAALNDLGDAMARAKKSAPTHPHPRAGDEPPGNLLVGAAAGVADRVRDTTSGIAQGSVTAVSDLVALILGRQKPRVQPTGSRATRSTAKRVRSGASDATDAAIEAVTKARDTGKRAVKSVRATGSAARKGAKNTTSTAKRGAKQTARTAKSSTKRTTGTARQAAKRTARRSTAAKRPTAKRSRAA